MTTPRTHDRTPNEAVSETAENRSRSANAAEPAGACCPPSELASCCAAEDKASCCAAAATSCTCV